MNWIDYLRQLRGAYSENTIRAYRTDFGAFELWCNQKKLNPLPASPETVAAYVEALTNVKCPASIRRYITGIGRIHRLVGEADPSRADCVALALRRMVRARGRRQKQAAGLCADLRDRLISACGDDLVGLRNQALIAVGYDTLCRRSELVALRAEDVERLADGAASILIRRAKTDQAGEGRLGYLSAETVERIERWQDASGIADGPLFRRIRGLTVGEHALHPYAVNRVLKSVAEKAGLPPQVLERLSGHSMRVGAALDMVENGIDLVPIMHAGGWKTPAMVLRYTQQISLMKSGMARLHAKNAASNHANPNAEF